MMKRAILPVILSAAIAMFRCSALPTAGNGGSSETVNARMIIADSSVCVTLPDGVDESLSVAFYSTAFHPYEGYGLADSVTGNGALWIAPGSGTYNIFTSIRPSGRMACIAARAFKAGIRDTLECALSRPVVLDGKILGPSAIDPADSFAVSIIGSPYYAITGSAQRFYFDALPAGRYQLSLRPAAGRFFLSSTTYAIDTVSPGTNVEITLVVQ